MALERPRYTDDAARRILQKAMDLQMKDQEGSFSRDQLAEMAQELGISTETLMAAEQEWLQEQEGRQEREIQAADIQAFNRERMQSFYAHLVPFVMVNLFLFIIFVTTGSDFPWFLFPLFGWGIGLASHYWAVRQREGEAYENELADWMEKRRLARQNQRKLTS
jgi:hypothetical protein